MIQRYFKILVLIFAVIIAICSNTTEAKAQLKEGNKMYVAFKYREAIPFYQKSLATKDSLIALLKIADCYRQLGSYENSAFYYGRALKVQNAESFNYFYYGHVLRYLGRYSEAVEVFKRYYQLEPYDHRVSLFCNYSGLTVSSKLKMKKVDSLLAFNSKNNDYGPVFFDNQLVFTSDRYEKTFSKKNEKFSGMFIAPYQGTPGGDVAISIGEPVLFAKELNTKQYDGPCTFSANYEKIVYSQAVKGKMSAKAKLNAVNLFTATKMGNRFDEFGRVQPFIFNAPSGSYDVAHPSLSSDGQKLYFSSNMPGGVGGTDIYVSTVDMGEWGKPELLDSNINTRENDMFPFIKGDTLFFASEGHGSKGKLDLFYTVKSEKGWSNAEPLPDVNTEYDEFGICVHPNAEWGFFSSDRDKGNENNLYAFKYTTTADLMNLSGIVKDAETNQPLAKATVFVWDTKTEKIVISITNDKGEYSAPVSKKSIIVVKVMKRDFKGECVKVVVDVPLTVESMTVADIPLGKFKKTDKFILNNVTYKLNRANISPAATLELDKVVTFMKDYPTLKVELSSHCDSRGKAKVNQKLSQKRAANARLYIVKAGIPAARIKAVGYGAKQLLNKCKRKVKCTEEQHAVNRRTELKIIGFMNADSQALSFENYKDKDVIELKEFTSDFFDNCNLMGTDNSTSGRKSL